MKLNATKVIILVGVCVLSAGAGLWIDRQFFSHKSELKTVSALDQVLSQDSRIVRPASVTAGEQPADFADAANKVTPCVVSVDNYQRQDDLFTGESVLSEVGTGSGVVISRDGYIVTNNHVIEGATAIRVRSSDKKSLQATLIGRDPRSDLALLKVDATMNAATLGSSSDLRVGEWVLAVGNPLGYDNTLSVGVVSCLNRNLAAPRRSRMGSNMALLTGAIQTDAAINQGNSGGALANANGEVIGINSMIASNSGGSIGLGFAIPIDQVKKIVKELKDKGRIDYGELGLVPFTGSHLLGHDSNRRFVAQQVGAEPPTEGLLVAGTYEGTPAAQSGISRYDIILSVDSKKISEPLDYYMSLSEKRAGQSVELELWSRGHTKKVKLTLAAVSEER